MSDLWLVAVTPGEMTWLENNCKDQLREALAATEGFWDSSTLAGVPLYENEWRWLAETVGIWNTAPAGLAYALNTAVPATHRHQMNREWTKRHESLARNAPRISLTDISRNVDEDTQIEG